jgi:predicted lysophospholipase L1 biosynthesis ABC-type transport system permease subunit
MTPRLSFIDRIICSAMGAVLGGLIGFALAWLLGVYSITFPGASVPVEIRHWIIGCATIFGVIGVLFGPFVGSVVGTVIAAIYESQNPPNPEMPTWLVVLLLIAIVAGAWWWLMK